MDPQDVRNYIKTWGALAKKEEAIPEYVRDLWRKNGVDGEFKGYVVHWNHHGLPQRSQVDKIKDANPRKRWSIGLRCASAALAKELGQ